MTKDRNRKFVLGTLIAAIVVTGIVAAMAIGFTKNGGQIPAAFSAAYVPPKQMNGMAIEASMKVIQKVSDPELGYIYRLEEGKPVTLISYIRDVDNPAFQFAGSRNVIEVFNATGTRVWGSDLIQDSLTTALKPGDQITVEQIWAAKIIKEPEDLENGKYEFLPAPLGVYTIRLTFEGGGVDLSDEITAVVEGVAK